MINELTENQVFCFGSNLAGNHVGGAAKLAREKFGAIMGQGEGLQGQSYAIATLDENLNQLPLTSIQAQLYILSEYAKENPNKEFLLTPIGTGIARYRMEEIRDILPKKSLAKNITLVGSWD